MTEYVDGLPSVLDLDVIRSAGVSISVDPRDGASGAYWPRIADRYGLHIASGREAALADHFLAVATDYLFVTRTAWPARAGAGKTVLTTSMIDRIAARFDRSLYEAPVGFQAFVEGLHDGSLGCAGDDRGGACFLRHDGTVWTTDADAIASRLLTAEITATGGDLDERYRGLIGELGEPLSRRIEVPATAAQVAMLATLSHWELKLRVLAGEPVVRVLDRVPGNDAPIGGLKVVTASGWFAALPSTTDDGYTIYAESFRDREDLRRIVREGQHAVDRALRTAAR